MVDDLANISLYQIENLKKSETILQKQAEDINQCLCALSLHCAINAGSNKVPGKSRITNRVP